MLLSQKRIIDVCLRIISNLSYVVAEEDMIRIYNVIQIIEEPRHTIRTTIYVKFLRLHYAVPAKYGQKVKV